MKPVDRQKMCANCDGRIPLEAEICPYCATEQSVEKENNSLEAPLFQHQSLQDSLASLYTPPYSGKKNTNEEEKKVPSSVQASTYKEPVMFKNVSEEKFQNSSQIALPQANTKEEEGEDKSSLWPTVLMVTGSNLLVLGLLQFFFSENGALKLQWDGSYWFLYCLAAAPLLFFGARKIKELD